MHSDFSRHVRDYETSKASEALDKFEFPESFELMREADPQRYRTTLSKVFANRSGNEIFLDFINLIKSIKPLKVITTNVDEQLERNISDIELIQQSDIERANALLHTESSFICKIHGSISSLDSMIFSASDYRKLTADENYLRFLRTVLSDSNVIFLGYSVRDEYVIKQLLQSQDERKLLGTGLHCVICPIGAVPKISHLRRIHYIPGQANDHREALEVLHIIANSAKQRKGEKGENGGSESMPSSEDSPSIYYIADLIPFGTTTTSQTLTVIDKNSVESEMVVGEGFINSEIQITGYSALHDLVVGLICYDQIVLHLNDLIKVYQIVGGIDFWNLIESDAIRAIYSGNQSAVFFLEKGAWTGGALSSITPVGEPNGLELPPQMTAGQFIQKSFRAEIGQEAATESLLEILESKVSEIPNLDDTGQRVSRALVNPEVRRLLGISPGMPIDTIPRWLVFPILRLAKVVRTAQVCEFLGASATRMIWGSEHLAGAAFCANSATESVDSAASYVLTGRFDSDLGSLIAKTSGLIQNVIKFRNSAAGSEFRKEIFEHLKVQRSSSLVASINSGLRQAIPYETLQKANNKMSGLFQPKDFSSMTAPTIWGDLRNGNLRIAQWRVRSRSVLKEAEKELKLTPYGACPCGSGEKFKFCCYAALNS